MAVEQALGEYRPVKIAFDVNTGKDIVNQVAQVLAPVDAFKAAARAVKESEAAYARYGASIADVTAKNIYLTGANPNIIHQFTLTTVLASGSYIFIYVTTKPNSDS